MEKMLNTPFIKDIYDPLTGSHDGTITPSAPIVVTGENLRLSALEETVLGLAPLENSGCLIQISHVCKYTDTHLLVVLPNLDPGTYSPVLQVYEAGKLVLVYVFPVVWRVCREGDVDYSIRYYRNKII